MHLEPSAEEKKLRAEARAYFAGVITDEVRIAAQGSEAGGSDAMREMGRAGWLTPGWPVEYGGKGLSPLMQKVVLEEIIRAEALFIFTTINMVAPTLMRHGTEQQKRDLLPRVAAGDVTFALGYTEPSGGTDLAGLKTRAVRDGDDYLINGQKVFTSGAEAADYIFLATRTDPNVPKHKGISMFLVDTKLSGFSFSPIWTVGSLRTNATFYDNVRVPASMMVGPENGGWRIVTEALNHERLTLAALPYGSNACFDEVVEWARNIQTADGNRLIDVGWVQLALAECYVELRALGLMAARVAWEVANDIIRPQMASAAKVYGVDTTVRVTRRLLDIMGAAGLVREGSAGAQLRGRIEREFRRCQISTFAGGTAEVLRDMIAQAGMNMPRAGK
jgi:alkylation response protein AidB-like acyl-CoA dehydrogenase